MNNITSIHVIGYTRIGMVEQFELEITEGNVTYTVTWGKEQTKDFISEFHNVTTYEDDEEEEIAYQLRRLKIGYIELETFADGSDEHDIYVHDLTIKDGTCTYDFNKGSEKTYKRETSARKYAHKLANELGYKVLEH